MKDGDKDWIVYCFGAAALTRYNRRKPERPVCAVIALGYAGVRQSGTRLSRGRHRACTNALVRAVSLLLGYAC